MRTTTAIVLLGAVLVCGCGKTSGLQAQGGDTLAGLPFVATKNTTRVAGPDAVADAAGAALAVYPGDQHPQTVALADARDWRSALATTALLSPPLRAPVLLSRRDSIPSATKTALERLHPVRVIGVGGVAVPSGPRVTRISGANPFALAAALAGAAETARGGAAPHVLIVSANAPAYAMPAAGWAAKSGDPVLFVTRNTVPPETRAALKALKQPRIYVLGPGSVVGRGAIAALKQLGSVKRIAGADPVANAIAFARYLDGDFGWGVVNPGHGLVFAGDRDPLVAPAAAAFSASGSYGPLLLVDRPDRLPGALGQYLLDIQPGYAKDPVRGVYNHGWLIGDERSISLSLQSQIDGQLEIAPVKTTP